MAQGFVYARYNYAATIAGVLRLSYLQPNLRIKNNAGSRQRDRSAFVGRIVVADFKGGCAVHACKCQEG